MKKTNLIVLCIIIFLVTIPAKTPVPPAADHTKNIEGAKQEILDWVCDKLNNNYVYPDTAKKMESFVRKKAKKGEYRKLKTVDTFVGTLSRDLRSVCKDRHLRVYIDKHLPPPDTATTEEKEKEAAARREQYRLNNYDFKEIEHLPGNVGYLRFDSFRNALYAGDTAVAALNFLANCDALIIDLRYNGGGDASMIQLMLSYFFDEPVHYNNMYIRNKNKTNQNWTSAHVQGKKMTAMDLYILTSRRTFSAAEEFTYDLKNLGRATVIGETTGGGAHPVEYQYLRKYDLALKIPFGRSYNPKTGIDWEGTGIEPHIKAEKEKAFDLAYTLALKTLHERLGESGAVNYKWYYEYRKAVTEPLDVEKAVMERYAGTYGPVKIMLKDNTLLIREPGANDYKKMLAIDKNLFAIKDQPDVRAMFEMDEGGTVKALQAIFFNGGTQRIPKGKEKE